MATISLGSHAIFHYYHHAPEDTVGEISPPSSKARPIRTTPVASLLLEPRSLVITTRELYTSHLHGIDGVIEDRLAVHSPDTQRMPVDDIRKESGVWIANWEMLGGDDEGVVRAVREGGLLKRGTRTSLTCRVVERVAQMGFGVGLGLS